MGRKRILRRHLPLIALRIGFEIQPLPLPPPIALRMNIAELVRRHAQRDDDSADATRGPHIVLPSTTSRPSRSVTGKKVTIKPSAKDSGKGRAVTPRRYPSPRATTPRATTPGPAMDSDSDSMSALTDLDSDLDEPATSNAKQTSSSRATMIKKPPGEPGRPGSGGFNLEKALGDLGWSKDDFESFRVGSLFIGYAYSLCFLPETHT